MSDYGMAEFTLRIGDGELQAKAMIPAGLARADDLVPIAHGLADSMASMAAQQAAAEGKTVSCRAGCGACCRQMVPVSEHEARHLMRVFEALPAARQEIVRARFRLALETFRDNGLLPKILNIASIDSSDRRLEVGIAYLQAQVACPFLENESCSIYEDRPTRCREYIVSSDPVYCVNPDADTVGRIPVPMKPSNALFQFGDGAQQRRTIILPLILALDWVAVQPPPAEASLLGPQLLQNYLIELEKL